jgi:cell division septum initiation protein DivIVA
LALLTNDSPYHERFHELLELVKQEVSSLKSEIKELKKENNQLKSRLEEIQEGQTDIFSAMTESERMALRHQILGLISKIDTHLEDER